MTVSSLTYDDVHDIKLLFLHELLDESLFSLTEICSVRTKSSQIAHNCTKQQTIHNPFIVRQLKQGMHTVVVERFFTIKTNCGSNCDLFYIFWELHQYQISE